MRAIDAMIVWTPDREPCQTNSNAGKVEVATIPEPPRLKAFPMSAGACDHDWREAANQGRIALIQPYFSQMIHRDGIQEAVARAALSRIDEFRDYPFSTDEPEDDE
ncbi:hypothetical protein AB4Y85_04345 [Microvirga sp. 2YAF29]|uniref:hypothetical protein n=1 Tax=Microvirga sp. 2YAF29 TaxID=3233031 RepID=UPI003F9EA955